MSRTKRGAKASGYDWWSRRDGVGKGHYGGKRGSAYGKRLTHKAERQSNKAKPADLGGKSQEPHGEHHVS